MLSAIVAERDFLVKIAVNAVTLAVKVKRMREYRAIRGEGPPRPFRVSTFVMRSELSFLDRRIGLEFRSCCILG